MIAIGVPDQNDSLLEVDLEGETFFLHFAWNSEAEFWTLGVESASHDTLVEGVVVVPDYPLLSRYRAQGMPAGDLLAVAPDRRDGITRASLPASETTLIYVSAAELIALLPAEITPARVLSGADDAGIFTRNPLGTFVLGSNFLG